MRIPNTLTDVTTDWIADLLYNVLHVPRPDKTDGTHSGITLLQIRARPTEGLKERCQVTAKCSSQPERVRHFLVEIVPPDPELREMIVKHSLFAKEILVYSEVLPLLKRYVRNRSKSTQTVDVTFSVPNYIYGDYDSGSGSGVIIFEDFSEAGFRLEDPEMMLIDPGHVREVVQSLATLHAICVAFQTTEEVKLEQRFPILDGEKGCTWFQEDMTAFLQEMYSTCFNFLQVKKE